MDENKILKILWHTWCQASEIDKEAFLESVKMTDMDLLNKVGLSFTGGIPQDTVRDLLRKMV